MSFEMGLRKFRNKVEGRTKAVLQKTALEVDKGVVMETRVDTGQARGGWNAGINNVNLSETENDKTGAKTIAKNELTIIQADADDTIFISNNVGHIRHLNDGTVYTRGDFMVEKTLRRFPQIVRESTNEAKRENP